MAELRKEETEKGEGPDCASPRCCGNPSAVRGIAINSLRGAAIALCMSPEELRELLQGKPKENEDTASLRVQIAELKSENASLKAELERYKSTNNQINESEREFLKLLGIRIVGL